MEVFVMSITVLEGIVIGGIGGAIAGLALWFVQSLKEIRKEQTDKDRVYNYLLKKTKKHRGPYIPWNTANDQRWVSTINIAAYTNLTQDRARYICSSHEKIILNDELLEEKWAIREFVASY